MAPGLAKVAPDLPKDGLRAVLGFLGDDWDWKTVGRASLVSKTWKTTIAAMESSIWQAALRARWHGYRASRVAGPHVVDAEALATCKSIAGLVVAPRRVHDDSVTDPGGTIDARDDTRVVAIGGLLKRNVDVPTLASILVGVRKRKIARMNAHWARLRASGRSSARIQGEYVIDERFDGPRLEAEAALKFIEGLIKRPGVSFGGRIRIPVGKGVEWGPSCTGCKKECLGESYFYRASALDIPEGLCPECADPEFKERAVKQFLEVGKAYPPHADKFIVGGEAKELLRKILHDVCGGDEFMRMEDTASLVDFYRDHPEMQYYGIDRDMLRGVFLDPSFASDDQGLTEALREKMASWSIFTAPRGRASEMYNVSNRHNRDECPPEMPTTEFFPGIQFNGDPVGWGDIFLALEHDLDTSSDFGDLFQYPVKSIVVLAQRAGRPTWPYKPGDPGYYENDGDY